jgi:hypothetical protein
LSSAYEKSRRAQGHAFVSGPVRSPFLSLGWQVVDPGLPPLSPLFDNPPTVADPNALPAAHLAWQRRVEQDQKRMITAHLRHPVWYPVALPTDISVLPVCGGTPIAWSAVATNAALSAAHDGCQRVTVLNLRRCDVTRMLGRAARSAGVGLRVDIVSPRGSTADLFGRLSARGLAGLVVDVFRSAPGAPGRAAAIGDKQELLTIADLLTDPVTLIRLHEAVAVVTLNLPASSVPSLNSTEVRALQDYRSSVAGPQVSNRLTALRGQLAELLDYQKSAARRPTSVGSGRPVRTIEIDGGTAQDHELGRELVVQAVSRGFANRRSSGSELLVVVGAELLSTEMLDELTDVAQRPGRRLVLLFTRITDDARRTFGQGGQDCVVFLRLPNSDDGEAAARYVGKQFTFVVNGFSIAEGNTEQWNESESVSSGVSSGTSTTSGSSSNLAHGALSVGRSFGRTVSTSFTSGRSSTVGTGGSQSRTMTASYSRDHDYVLQPEEFRKLPDDQMLVVRGQTAVLASCDPRIATLPVTSSTPLAAP